MSHRHPRSRAVGGPPLTEIPVRRWHRGWQAPRWLGDRRGESGPGLACADPLEMVSHADRRWLESAQCAGSSAGKTAASITHGAARAWWPIQSSKLAGPGSPRLGRFDSFAASYRCRCWRARHRPGSRLLLPWRAGPHRALVNERETGGTCAIQGRRGRARDARTGSSAGLPPRSLWAVGAPPGTAGSRLEQQTRQHCSLGDDAEADATRPQRALGVLGSTGSKKAIGRA